MESGNRNDIELDEFFDEGLSVGYDFLNLHLILRLNVLYDLGNRSLAIDLVEDFSCDTCDPEKLIFFAGRRHNDD